MESSHLGKAKEGGSKPSKIEGRAPTAIAEPSSSKDDEVIVECILQPTNSRRRCVYPLKTSLSHIASEIESALVVPAKVEAISLSENDSTNASASASLAVCTTLDELGARLDSVFTLWVALKRVEETNKDDAVNPVEKDEKHQTITKDEVHQDEGANLKDNTEMGLETEEEPLQERNPSSDLAIAIERWRAFSTESLFGPERYRDHILPAAGTQTADREKRLFKTRFHAETQTHTWENSGVQLNREGTVQMEKKGLHISRESDKVLFPRPYFTADALDELKERKAIILQAHIRSFLARRKAAALRRAKEELLEQTRAEEERVKREHELCQRRLRNRCLHPETYDDISVLYKELEAWRLQEVARIKAVFVNEVHRRQAFKDLLKKETELLQHIEELKLNAMKSSRKEKIQHLLDSMAKPFAWACPSTGDVTTVYTPETIWAEQLRNLYLELDDLTHIILPDRINVLQRVRETVQMVPSAPEDLVHEILELTRREIDFLERGRTNKTKLSGLRQRTSHTFWHLVQSPSFNPQAARFLKRHLGASTRVGSSLAAFSRPS